MGKLWTEFPFTRAVGNSSVPCQRTDTHQTQASGTSKANQAHMFIEHFLGTNSVLRLSLCVQSTGLSCSEAQQSASYRAHSNTKSHSTQQTKVLALSLWLLKTACVAQLLAQTKALVVYCAPISGLHFPFSSTFYFNVFSSEATVDLFCGTKKRRETRWER